MSPGRHLKMIHVHLINLLSLPANEVCEGYVFTSVCHSVHGGLVCLSTCWDTPHWADTPWADKPGAETTPSQTLPGRQHPPPEIRAISGRYASYWNAYLL